jgi:hypothetical protein
LRVYGLVGVPKSFILAGSTGLPRKLAGSAALYVALTVRRAAE